MTEVPSASGSPRSRTTRSGRCASQARSASPAVPASATRYPWASRFEPIRARVASSSSTTSSRGPPRGHWLRFARWLWGGPEEHVDRQAAQLAPPRHRLAAHCLGKTSDNAEADP